jgi:hypothetical protein
MRLQDIYGIKRHAVTELLVQLVEGGNLPPERRSGIAAEHQNDWLLAPER